MGKVKVEHNPNPDRCKVCLYFKPEVGSAFGKCREGMPKINETTLSMPLPEGKVNMNSICQNFIRT